MKKALVFLCAMLLVFSVVGVAGAVAIPFQVGTGGFLEETEEKLKTTPLGRNFLNDCLQIFVP